MMKRVFLMLLTIAISATVAAQKVYHTDSKRHRGGNQNIVKVEKDGITEYGLSLQSNNQYYGNIVVHLGTRENAIRLMRWLADYEGKKSDRIDLETGDGAWAKPVKVMGIPMYRVYTGGSRSDISALVAKKQLRDFADMLEKDEF